MSIATTDDIVRQAAHGNPIIERAIHAALERSVRYRIPASKHHDKMGTLWLVAGGPKSQTYWTEDRIVKEYFKHDPSCTPAYLCDACVDLIVDSINDPNKDEIIRQVHQAASERMEANIKENANV